MFDFHGQHLLITGGAKGIGYEIVKAFANAHASISIFDEDALPWLLLGQP